MDVIMPSLGFDMTEGKLLQWLKKEGDRVEKGQAIAEIETEKAAVEVEALGSGVLTKILVQPGTTVPVGTVMAVIGEAAPTAAQPAPAAQPTPARADGGGLAAETAQAPTAAQGPAHPAAPAPPSVTPPLPPVASGEAERIKATPIARKMATEAGIDLRTLKGTGPNGRIMERDIQSAMQQVRPAVVEWPKPPAAPVAPAPQPARAPSPAPTATAAAPGTTVELSRMRQTIARRMTESKTTVPHFYVTMEINMAEAMKVREQLNALSADKISVNDLVVAAAARTLKSHPHLNASFHGDKLEMHEPVNVGIAVAVDQGLITPVLHDADKKSLRAIAADSKAMTERARANKLHAEDFGPGTFTVSNLGMFGVDEFVAIINPPEAAILAVGAVAKRPIIVEDEVVVAPVMRVTLSVDHRVADGAQAARYLQDLKKLLENPVNLLVS